MAETLSTCLRESARTPTAFTGVYEAMASELLAFLLRRTFDVEVARDLTAETFARAFEHRGRFRGDTDAEASAWLYGIARNLLARYARDGVTERRAVERLGIRVPAVSEDDHQRIVELAGLADMRATVADLFSSRPTSATHCGCGSSTSATTARWRRRSACRRTRRERACRGRCAGSPTWSTCRSRAR